jgi:hypothetical protein
MVGSSRAGTRRGDRRDGRRAFPVEAMAIRKKVEE